MLKAAIIIDGDSITKWQKDALDAASDLIDVRLILSCTNTNIKRKYTKNLLYYILNYFTLKNHLTNRVKLSHNGIKHVEFKSSYDGSWQKIPDSITDELANSQADIIIKFGMSLLRIEGFLNNYKILSFHHGDPSQYRGRPAGFYEILQNNSSVGTIVQEISNKLDAGRIWAICHSKIHHHSYKNTAINFYTNSKFLLRKALINLSKNSPIDILPNGKNYKLPSNFLVVKFISIIFFRKLKRFFYGAFYEKKWNIATYDKYKILDNSSLLLKEAKQASIIAGYNFYADPFFSADGETIRLEALSSKNGLGQILEVDTETLSQKNILLKGHHFSYPFSFSLGDEEYLMPEVASHSAPYILKKPFNIEKKINLRGLESYRVVDATLIKLNDTIYLFCGMNSNAANCLYLFHSEGIDKDFLPHPLNPVIIDPSRARMGGRIISHNGRLYRFGQNNSYGYGNGVSVCEITKISPTEYEEKLSSSLNFKDASGPHTVDIFENKSVFDFYVDTFSLFAWYRRVIPIVLKLLKK
ncbi:glucosamine inositolphosphorylceramide transferase family protein [Pseudomonas sp. St29]|uniref:glucosamine inositolphosphorylceramide transferase family protein n=1 Tax=Pseudomonas sp. St29 TaxID=1500687 RepID=UPI0005FC586F|nr:hypothetical protein [Pseudomonas sp. St29]BAQ80363.1 putative uncharacterized protein [Pseudomonas sp. St29]